MVKIALLYPPPWKIPGTDEAPDPEAGPPPGFGPEDFGLDFFQAPIGLLSLAAQAKRAGHTVTVLNLSGFPWRRVEEALDELDADLFGMTCYTANRRGVPLVADAIKQRFPKAHVVVGGPHTTALPTLALEHWPSVDTIVVGEGEDTFADLIERLEKGAPVDGLPGAVQRVDGRPVAGPQRTRISDLDTLVSPNTLFPSHIAVTARGCPSACTFCGSRAAWGKSFRSHSAEYVLDSFEQSLPLLPVRMLLIKDDIFPANRKRAMAICQGIVERKLNFVWSCDSRADRIDDELMKWMRLAGCKRISMGVESGSQTILKNIRKDVMPDEIIEATETARKWGVQARWYMIVGNRGETAETLRETVSFIERARPHQMVFNYLSVYPGTPDYQDLVAQGRVDPETYFTRDFLELQDAFDASDADKAMFQDWFSNNMGTRQTYDETVQGYRDILERLGGQHADAQLDLAIALLAEGQLDEAEHYATQALAHGHPLPGLAQNTLACVAAARGDLEMTKAYMTRAVKADPMHGCVRHNFLVLQQWIAEGRPGCPPFDGALPRKPHTMSANQRFELFERATQPVLPAPLRPRTTKAVA